ncbi:hypothetical protein PAAG_01646 [Paracoccidioides lutzii Pb01]|uniref:Uncharacterized protein n=1 Tax=Paracoccidioides lutzii (strain ATCC MYA-826 / Pb01) TaxID=502779 RepID=C1GT01_PARBA|nr:hypothetical protein PAAG_01646 [Paracoccidioides lutzii Pb01]EEH39184.2 hypothetical protein PAAG_01646 [Paracoccidioides lutzii Pb01]
MQLVKISRCELPYLISLKNIDIGSHDNPAPASCKLCKHCTENLDYVCKGAEALYKEAQWRNERVDQKKIPGPFSLALNTRAPTVTSHVGSNSNMRGEFWNKCNMESNDSKRFINHYWLLEAQQSPGPETPCRERISSPQRLGSIPGSSTKAQTVQNQGTYASNPTGYWGSFNEDACAKDE